MVFRPEVSAGSGTMAVVLLKVAATPPTVRMVSMVVVVAAALVWRTQTVSPLLIVPAPAVKSAPHPME